MPDSDTDDSLPYEPPRKIARLPTGAMRASRAAERHSTSRNRNLSLRENAILEQLRELPQDVRHEYLGPNFDFGSGSLAPYERAAGLEYFTRAFYDDPEIPDILVQIHPDVFLELSVFQVFAACASAKCEQGFHSTLWSRHVLVEAHPYKSKFKDFGPFCKRQREQLDKELGECSLAGLPARLVWQKFEKDRLVDSGRYNTLAKMDALTRSEPPDVQDVEKERERKQNILQHFEYLRSKMGISEKKLDRAIDFGKRLKLLPDLILRKSQSTFVSGELVEECCRLFQAKPISFHNPDQAQFLRYNGRSTRAGEYISLFSHIQTFYPFPNHKQTVQLGLKEGHQFKNRTDFEDRYPKYLEENCYSYLKELLIEKDIEEKDYEEVIEKPIEEIYEFLTGNNTFKHKRVIKTKDEFVADETEKYRDGFYRSMNTPVPTINSRLSSDSDLLYLTIDLDAVLKSKYHKIRHAISLLENKAPFDPDRCEQIKQLLNLDDHLRYVDPSKSRSAVAADRSRKRDRGR